MQSRARSRAVVMSRAYLGEINAFVLHGAPLSPFMTALMVHDQETATRLANAEVHKHQIVPMLASEIAELIPEGMFAGDESAVDAWIDHRGFDGASEKDKLLFYFMNERWHPDRRMPLHDA